MGLLLTKEHSTLENRKETILRLSSSVHIFRLVDWKISQIIRVSTRTREHSTIFDLVCSMKKRFSKIEIEICTNMSRTFRIQPPLHSFSRMRKLKTSEDDFYHSYSDSPVLWKFIARKEPIAQPDGKGVKRFMLVGAEICTNAMLKSLKTSTYFLNKRVEYQISIAIL